MLKELEFIPDRMKAVVTLGNGGVNMLSYQDREVPKISAGEVLIKVFAAGVNNTEINTRLCWYSDSVSESTSETSRSQEDQREQKKDGGWNKATPFPFVQGTDCCGLVVSAGDESGQKLLGERVLVRSCMRSHGFDSMENVWMASDFDGAFAQYVKVPASEVFPVNCDWSHEELAAIPCAYGSSENMVHRAKVGPTDTVLVTGASGGIGIATIQLCKRRKAKVIAIAGAAKMDKVLAAGADHVISRDDDLLSKLEEESIDVVIDNVAGDKFPHLLKLLKRGGRYASSGAIGGPIVSMDMRVFYLKDLSLIGCTAWDEPVFPNLVKYIEAGEIRPIVSKTFALEEIADAQLEFLEKKHIGKFVLVP